jgi:CubicO group peptidase (beta-lactamase class C family)
MTVSAPEVVDPADLGVDPAAVEALVERAHREVDAGLLPSCQLALAREGRLVAFETIGGAEPGSRYVIFSSTKPFVASVVWQLIAEGRVDPAQLVTDFIPEFGANGKDVITVEQVMLHTSGFPHAPLGPPDWYTREGRLARMANWRLNWEPGTRYEYHPTSAHWVLAEIIERVDGEDYRAALRRRVIEPIGLTGFALGLPEDEQEDVNQLVLVGEAPTPGEIEEITGIAGLDLAGLVGEVTEQALITLGRPENLAVGVPGGGGVATAADVALFYQALLHDDRGLWDPDVLADATGRVRNTMPDPWLGVPANRALGVVVAGDDGLASRRGMGHTCGPRTFGHNGAGGQLAWADPDSGLSFCYLTNGLDAHLIRQWRRGPSLSNRAAVCAGERKAT